MARRQVRAVPSRVVTTKPALPLNRMEGLSDGVIAIAITLLVLELAVDPGSEERLLRSILDEWPSYLAYVTSFLTIGVVWMLHAGITSALRAADATLFRLNLLVLLLVSFLPFPTKLVGEYVEDEDAERVAVVFYGLTLLALAVAIAFLVRYAFSQPQLVKEHVDDDAIATAANYRPSYALYLIAIGIGLVLPIVGVALYLGIALYLGVPARTIRGLLRRG
jgi:uncharacterized membrane protein